MQYKLHTCHYRKAASFSSAIYQVLSQRILSCHGTIDITYPSHYPFQTSEELVISF